MKLGQNLKTLRDNNLAVLLSTIWDYKNISRAKLAKITGLAPSSVTRLTQELHDIGLIVEIGKGTSSGGRQPVLISPNPKAGIVISFDLSGSRIQGGVFDASNQLLKADEIPLLNVGPDAIQNYIFQLLDNFLTDESLSGEKLLGVGVCIPGVVNIEKTGISIAYNLQLRDFPLKRILEDKYNIPVYLETDTSVAALAENIYGAAVKKNNFIYILISTGIGTGIIKNGEIYKGQAGMDGKRGHIVIDTQGPLCVCGKRGCLEAIAGRKALLENAKLIFSDGTDQIVTNLISGNINNLDLSIISEAAQMGSEKAKGLIDNMAEHVAYAISLYVTILDIPLVIIGGEVALELGNYFIQSLNREVLKFIRKDENVTIIQTQLKRGDFLRGISMLAIQQILQEKF